MRLSAFFAAILLLGSLPNAARAATPDITISDVSAAEGTNGNTNFDFTVTLSKAVATDVTVDFMTVNGTAIANGDYLAASSTLTIPANELSGTISIEVVGDALKEDDETFFVKLSNPSAGQITDNEGLGTIEDDDPTIWIDNVSELEGNSGHTNFVFTVRLSRALTQNVTVDFASSDGTATIADADYEAVSGTLTIRRGRTTARLVVRVNGDTNDEGTAPEIFNVTLSNPSLGTIADGDGEGAIIDDDPLNTGVDVPVTEFALGSVWPNPARRIASVGYALPRQTHVRLTVFDLQGREVAVLVDAIRAAGRYTAEWEGRGQPHGTYFYRIQAGGFVQTRKFTFLK